jgi:hypothetical protein
MITYTGGKGSAAPKRQRSGIPFLSREHVSTDKRMTEILAVKQGTDNRGGDQVSLKINYAGVVYLWNLRTANPNIKTLVELFGGDEERWAGKKFLMALQQDDFTGVSWPTVFPDESSSRKR